MYINLPFTKHVPHPLGLTLTVRTPKPAGWASSMNRRHLLLLRSQCVIWKNNLDSLFFHQIGYLFYSLTQSKFEACIFRWSMKFTKMSPDMHDGLLYQIEKTALRMVALQTAGSAPVAPPPSVTTASLMELEWSDGMSTGILPLQSNQKHSYFVRFQEDASLANPTNPTNPNQAFNSAKSGAL